jgi:hypothetical protein
MWPVDGRRFFVTDYFSHRHCNTSLHDASAQIAGHSLSLGIDPSTTRDRHPEIRPVPCLTFGGKDAETAEIRRGFARRNHDRRRRGASHRARPNLHGGLT